MTLVGLIGYPMISAYILPFLILVINSSQLSSQFHMVSMYCLFLLQPSLFVIA